MEDYEEGNREDIQAIIKDYHARKIIANTMI